MKKNYLGINIAQVSVVTLNLNPVQMDWSLTEMPSYVVKASF